MVKNYTTESFKEAFYDKFPESKIQIISEYTNTKSRIKCKCSICDYEWTILPNNLLKRGTCANCSGVAKYTTESFKKKYYEKFPESRTDIIGEYVNSISNVKCKCKD